MKYIGAHVSISGGVENAPLNASALGADAFAMFTKNQRQWGAPPYDRSAIDSFTANCHNAKIAPANILPHDSYLINLGQPDPDKRNRALGAFIDEMRRCAALGLDKLNFHPGSHLKQVSLAEDLALIAEAVRTAVDTVPGVTAVYENAAGQGSNVGFELEQLATLLELTDRPGRVGVCIDSCHAFVSGYNLADGQGYEDFWKRFEALIGFEKLRGMHLNDSKGECGCKVDRHESLGRGCIGGEFFRRLMRDPRFDGIPLILETPDESLWRDEIAMLREFGAQGR